MVLKGRLQKKKHMAGEKYGVERRKNRKGGYEKCKRVRDAAFFLIIMLVTFAATL